MMVINKGVWWGGRRGQHYEEKGGGRRAGRGRGGDGSVQGNREEKVRRGDTTARENAEKVRGKAIAPRVKRKGRMTRKGTHCKGKMGDW